MFSAASISCARAASWPGAVCGSDIDPHGRRRESIVESRRCSITGRSTRLPLEPLGRIRCVSASTRSGPTSLLQAEPTAGTGTANAPIVARRCSWISCASSAGGRRSARVMSAASRARSIQLIGAAGLLLADGGGPQAPKHCVRAAQGGRTAGPLRSISLAVWPRHGGSGGSYPTLFGSVLRSLLTHGV